MKYSCIVTYIDSYGCEYEEKVAKKVDYNVAKKIGEDIVNRSKKAVCYQIFIAE